MSDLLKFSVRREARRPFRPYSLLSKTKAFCRGLVNCQPLVEIAKEGLRNHVLDFETEIRYAKTVSNNCIPHEVFDVLCSECSEPAQQMLALSFKHAFERGLRALSIIAHYTWEDGKSYQLFRAAGQWTAQDLEDIREMETLLLTNGSLTSKKAQELLVPTFRHFNIVDTHFGYFVTSRNKQVRRILESPHVAQGTKELLIRETKHADKIKNQPASCLPINPYDLKNGKKS